MYYITKSCIRMRNSYVYNSCSVYSLISRLIEVLTKQCARMSNTESKENIWHLGVSVTICVSAWTHTHTLSLLKSQQPQMSEMVHCNVYILRCSTRLSIVSTFVLNIFITYVPVRKSIYVSTSRYMRKTHTYPV